MTSFRVKLCTGFLAVVAAAWLSGCTDVVYRDRKLFNPAPDAASGMLGYYTPADKQTTCGNCHVGQQADWIQTAHANAWADLQANPNAQPFCEACHTVNSRGNQAPAQVGYDKVKDAGYHDVQCESCHGGGETHVQNPTLTANIPTPAMNVYPSVAVPDTAAVVNSSCGACHQGAGPSQNHNYLREWRASRHGILNTYAAPRTPCNSCHEGKGALVAFGVTTVYRELGSTTLMPQNCVVCHDPHGKGGFAGQTRFSLDSPDPLSNLCTRCHQYRPDASATNSRGPHGAQGGVLDGTAGYFPPGTVYDTSAILSTHGSSANPRLCAGCHVNRLNAVDAGGNPITFTGHSFHPIPCVLGKAPVTVDTTFSNACNYDEPSRSWATCTKTGCHGSEAVAASLLNFIQGEKDLYIRTLWTDLDGDRTLDAYPTDTGYVARVKQLMPTELIYDTLIDKTNALRLTPAKGALFNAQMLGEHLASHPDGSHGVHNPFLIRAVLQSSIADMLANYGAILPAPPPEVTALIQRSIQEGKLRMAPQTEQAILDAYRAQVAGSR